jgi:hypothetical protein
MTYIKKQQISFRTSLYDISQTSTYGGPAVSAARDFDQVNRVFTVATGIEGRPRRHWGATAWPAAAPGGGLGGGLGCAAD